MCSQIKGNKNLFPSSRVSFMIQSETLFNNLFTPHHYIVFFKVLNWVLFIFFKIINYMVSLCPVSPFSFKMYLKCSFLGVPQSFWLPASSIALFYTMAGLRTMLSVSISRQRTEGSLSPKSYNRSGFEFLFFWWGVEFLLSNFIAKSQR